MQHMCDHTHAVQHDLQIFTNTAHTQTFIQYTNINNVDTFPEENQN